MLLDFRFHLYTDFVFGKGAENQVGSELKRLGATKVLVVYGGGNYLFSSGLLDGIMGSLKTEGIETFELAGVKPNPRISKVREGIALCLEHKIDYILAVGGGSVIDTCKAVGIGYFYDGDVWDICTNPSLATDMLPLAVVLTYPASGSESSTGAVLTNDDVVPHIKRAVGGPFARPQITFMNPELTYTLPRFLTGCGIADMYVHIMERYFSNISPGCIDYLAEGLFRSLIDFGPRVLDNPDNYENRAEIMWIGTVAHNDMVGVGRPQDWATHGMGHEISAFYDTAHGATLTIVGPAWMQHVYKNNVARFARYARNVFCINEDSDELAAIAGIEKTKEFFRSLGMPTSFAEGNIPTDALEQMADRAVAHSSGHLGSFKSLTKEDILEIYRLAR